MLFQTAGEEGFSFALDLNLGGCSPSIVGNHGIETTMKPYGDQKLAETWVHVKP